jgi:hypothetical protein
MTALHPERVGRMLFITGGAVSPRTSAFVERPDVTVLPKPFGVADLVAALDRLADAAPTGDADRGSVAPWPSTSAARPRS